jgi:hypothetical protein
MNRQLLATCLDEPKSEARTRAHSESFAKADGRPCEFRTQCFWSAMRPRIAFSVDALHRELPA